ncbi:TPA: LysR substrate-binding domain-containing protein [Citrobacter freundii]
MNSTSLNLFKTVAETGSIAAAARNLHCVASNVTTRLKQLEASLDVSLFVRERNRLHITPEGELLLRYANKILALLDEATLSMQATKAAGPLRIGAMETTAAVRLPSLLADFHREMPAVELNLKTSPTEQLVQQVIDSELDIAFVADHNGLYTENSPLQTQILCQEKLVLVTTAEHQDVRTGADLQVTRPLVFVKGCNYRSRLKQWLQSQAVACSAPLEFGSFQAILGCVSAGMGIALLPESVVRQYESHFPIRSHPIAPQTGQVNTMMIWRKNREISRVLNCFVSFIAKSELQPRSLAEKVKICR